MQRKGGNDLSYDKQMWQTRTKQVQNRPWLNGKGDPQGIVQKIKFCPYYQMIHKTESIWENEIYKLFWDLWYKKITESWPEDQTL